MPDTSFNPREIPMATANLTSNLSEATSRVHDLAGAACATLAAAFLLLGGMLLLAQVMPTWLAALAVAAAVGATSVALIVTGRTRIGPSLAESATNVISKPESVE